MNVLDASAVLTVINDEPGAAEAAEAQSFFDHALISSVNLAEVLQKGAAIGLDPEELLSALRETEIGIVPFDDAMAAAAARLWPLTRSKGLSLADRACLALAAAVSGIAVTADRAWGGLELSGVAIHVIGRG